MLVALVELDELRASSLECLSFHIQHGAVPRGIIKYLSIHPEHIAVNQNLNDVTDFPLGLHTNIIIIMLMY